MFYRLKEGDLKTSRKKSSKSMSSGNSRSEDDVSSDYSSSEQDTENSKQVKLGPETWINVPAEIVKELPEGIDGLKVFQLNDIPKNEHFNALKDGRRWKKSCPSSWKGHGRVRFADCKGSLRCINDSCPYKVHYGVVNRSQFDKNSKCKTCSQAGEAVPCSARRYIIYGITNVKVHHYGQHTCPSKMKTTGNIKKIKELITENPKIKPAEVQSSIVLSGIWGRLSWEALEKEATTVMNRKQIANIKQKMKSDSEPYGHNFEALVHFKEFCDKKDPFYLYKMNDRRGNTDLPSFVFKTSP